VRVQRHLSECRDARDREDDVRRRTIEFDDMTDKVVYGTFDVTLPACFARASNEQGRAKEGDQLNNPRKIQDDQNRFVQNNDQPDEFKMKPSENWDQLKGPSRAIVPKVNDIPMCKRWFTRGACFLDCRHAGSHIPGSQIDAATKQA
jgi:hypothetical protein